MKTVCIFALATIVAVLLLISNGPVNSKIYCSYFYYYSKARKGCTLCTDYCRPGTGLIRNCGYDDNGNKVSAACLPCQKGYYNKRALFPSMYRPSPPCQRCKDCFPGSRIRRPCSPTRNAKCGRCPRGMYKDKDGHCYKCSYCCNRMLESKTNVVASCRRRGMGRCSCTQETKCSNYDSENAQCDALRLRKRRKRPAKATISY